MPNVRLSLFSLPDFDDGKHRRLSHLIYLLLALTGVVNLVNALGNTLFTSPFTVQIVKINAVFLAGQAVVLLLLKRGWITTAGWLLSLLFWLGITWVAAGAHGLFNPVFALSSLVIVISGLLVGPRGAAVIGGLSSTSGLALAFQARRGAYLTEIGSMTVELVWVNYVIVFVVLSVMMFIGLRAINQSIEQMAVKERALSDRNAELHETREQYRRLLEVTPVMVSVYSMTDGQVLYTNPAGANLLGVASAADLIGTHIEDYLLPEYEALMASRYQLLAAGQPTPRAELRFKRPDGQLVDVEIRAAPIVYQGTPAILGVANDLSESRRAQQDLFEAALLKVEVAKEREMLELKARFLSMMSHEFRTPLSSIQTAKDMLEMYFERLSPDKRSQYLRGIGAQVQYMTQLLNDALMVSKAQANGLEFKPDWMNLERFSQNLLTEIQQNDSEGHTFVFSADGRLHQVCADERLIHHILSNLLSNAVKYSPGGGSVRLELERVHTEAVIRVSDDGIGIPAADQQHVFEPFQRASNIGGIFGTGLGLAIVHSSVAAHGGTITVDSAEGQGAVFTVRLPLLPAVPLEGGLSQPPPVVTVME